MFAIYVIISKISISCDTVSELVSDRPGYRDAYASKEKKIRSRYGFLTLVLAICKGSCETPKNSSTYP